VALTVKTLVLAICPVDAGIDSSSQAASGPEGGQRWS
jgi:hypothetical protein